MRNYATWRNFAGMTAQEPERRTLTVREASESLGIPTRTLQNMIQAGTVAARKVSEAKTSPYLIPDVEVERLRKVLDDMRRSPGVWR